MNPLSSIDSLNINGTFSVLGEIKLPDSLSVCVNYADNIVHAPNTIVPYSEFFFSVIIPAIVSISIFFLGYYFKNKHEKELAVIETENYRLIVFVWVDSIKSNIDKQIASCLEFASRLEKSQNIDTERLIVYRLLADEMKGIGIDRFIKTFMINSTNPNNDNDKKLFTIVSHFRYIEKAESQLIIYYKKYEDYIKSLKVDWANKYLKLLDLHEQFSPVHKEQNIQEHEFYMSVNKIHIEYNEKCKYMDINTMQIKDNLLKPLKNLVGNEVIKKDHSQYVESLGYAIRDLEIIINKWINYALGTALLFKGCADDLKYSYDILVEAKTYFKNETKVKNIDDIKN